MATRDTNVKIWDELYSQNDHLLSYPDEVLVRIVHRLLDRQKHRKILDYGFGSGSNMIHLLKKGFELSGVEVSGNAVVQVESRLKDLKLSADLRKTVDGKIPFEDSQFDVVLAWLVLYYNDWDSSRQAMSEIHRVLKPGGIFLGTMAAPGDYSHTHSIPLGDGVFRSTVPGQEGSTVMILEEDALKRCFPGRDVTIGNFGYQFGERHARHWIVSYEK